MPRLNIPHELLILYPTLTKDEIRTIIQTVWKSKNNRTRQSHIFKLKIPHIGVIRSRGNKKPKHRKKTMTKDRKRKREAQRQKNLTIESLLF